MYRYVFLSVFFWACSVSYISGQVLPQTPPEPDEIPASDLNGIVEEITIEESVLRGSSASTQGNEGRREVLRFEEGRLIEQVQFQPRETFAGRTRFRYDSFGRLTERIHINKSEIAHWRLEYVYDHLGRLVREVSYGPGGLVDQVTVYEYVDGQLLETVRYGRDGKVEWRRVYEYESNGVSWDFFTADGLRLKQVEQFFDEEGRLLREQHRDQYETLFDDIRYRFDTEENPREILRLDEAGVVKQRDTYRYDSNGNPVYHETVRPIGGYRSYIVFEYRYDARGNWIERNAQYHSEEDGTVVITREKRVRRDITYSGGEDGND